MFKHLLIFLFIFHYSTSHDSTIDSPERHSSLDPPSKEEFRDDIYEINSKMEKQDKLSTRRSDGECPDMRTCLHSCVMGHVIGPDGCEFCESCITEGLMESDIIVDESSYKDIEQEYGAGCEREKQRGASKRKELQWPKSGEYVTIEYTFHHTVSKSKKKNIRKAIREYKRKTCIRFKPRTTQKDYIRFVGNESRGCSSYVGRQRRGAQDVTIGRNCDIQLGTIIHELMHAIGFWHEQSRGDRDKHVEIKFGNIRPYAKRNFQRRTSQDWDSYGSPYDTGSVMHYGGFFFSNGLRYGDNPTIVDRKTGKPVVAQRNGFSPEDIKQINTKYQCTEYLTPSKSSRPSKTTTTPPPRTTSRRATATKPPTSGNCKDLRTG